MDKSEVLCIYGIDKQENYNFLNTWIKKKDHYVVFLEDDPNVDLSSNRFFKHPKVSIYKIESESQIEYILKQIAWQFLFLEIDLRCSKKYQSLKDDLFEKIKRCFEYITNGVHLSASTFSDHGLNISFNIYSNISRNRSMYCLKNMLNCFKQIPIIICGAGPSLDQSIPILKKLKDQALIFAGGTALTILDKVGISPHLIANIDPSAPKIPIKEKVPYFFPWKVKSENLPNNINPKILCSAQDPYLFDKWIEEELHLSFDYLNMGWTVTTFMSSLAIYFGCNPIIFVGNDLAIDKNKIYGKRASIKSIRKKNQQTYILAKDKCGNFVQTQKDWKMAADWFQKISENRKDILFFDTCRSGLNLGKHVSYLDLNEVLNWKRFDLKKNIASLFTNQTSHELSTENIFSKIYFEMTDKLNFCNEKIKRLEDRWNRQQYDAEEDIKENTWCDQYLLNPLWEIFKYLYIRNINKDNFFSFKLELYKTLFFKEVLEKHIKLVEKFHASYEVSRSK